MNRLRTAALSNVGSPIVAGGSLHGREHTAGQHENAQIPAGMFDELLQVQHALQPFQRPKRAPGQLSVGDADHASAFGAEQRLDHDVAAEGSKRLQGGVGVLTGDGLRHR